MRILNLTISQMSASTHNTQQHMRMNENERTMEIFHLSIDGFQP